MGYQPDHHHDVLDKLTQTFQLDDAIHLPTANGHGHELVMLDSCE